MHKKLLNFIFTISAGFAFATTQAQSISITSSTPDTICSGTSVTFTETSSGGTHYQWLKNSVVISGATNTTYVTTTLANGDVIMCELLSAPGGFILALSNPKTMTVQATPVVAAITGADTVCRLSTTTLSDATAGGAWNTTNPLIASVSSSGVVTGIAAGLDTITYSVTNTCGSASSMKAIYVNTSPVLAAITGPSVVCMGATVTYTDTPAIGTWNVSTPGVGTISPTGVFTPASTGADTLFYTASNACGTTTRRKTIGVESTPIIPPILGGTSVCQNDTIHLRDAPGGTWHSDNNGLAGVTTSGPGGGTGIVRGIEPGMVTIVYVGANACGIDSATISITVNPAPVVYPIIGKDSICPGTTELLLESVTGGTWSSFNSTIASIDTLGIVSALTAGVDTMYYTVTNSCGVAVEAFTVAVYCPSDVSVPVVTSGSEVSIYPNPAREQFTIAGVTASQVQIVNVYGQIVNTVNHSNSILLGGLAEGVYFVTVFDEAGNVAAKQRIVKLQ